MSITRAKTSRSGISYAGRPREFWYWELLNRGYKIYWDGSNYDELKLILMRKLLLEQLRDLGCIDEKDY